MVKATCPVCGNENFKNFQEIERLQATQRLLCLACYTAFIPSPLPYKPEYTLDYNLHFFRLSDIRKAYLMAEELHKFIQPRLITSKILEAGVGNGLTTLMLKLLGHDIEGCDISADTAKFLNEYFELKIYPNAFEEMLGKDKYNLIYASHLIEHYDQPKTFFNVAHRLLKDRGYLVVDTPNLEDSGNCDKDWHHFKTRDPLEHACVFSPRSFRSIAWTSGFEVLNIEKFKDYGSMQVILKRAPQQKNNI